MIINTCQAVRIACKQQPGRFILAAIRKGLNVEYLKDDLKADYYSEDGIVGREGVTHQQENSFQADKLWEIPGEDANISSAGTLDYLNFSLKTKF